MSDTFAYRSARRKPVSRLRVSTSFPKKKSFPVSPFTLKFRCCCYVTGNQGNVIHHRTKGSMFVKQNLFLETCV